jgi:hypothetical protein
MERIKWRGSIDRADQPGSATGFLFACEKVQRRSIQRQFTNSWNGSPEISLTNQWTAGRPGLSSLSGSKVAENINQRLICSPSFGREARYDVAEVALVEGGVLVDRASEDSGHDFTCARLR